jgi:hypothetical protein
VPVLLTYMNPASHLALLLIQVSCYALLHLEFPFDMAEDLYCDFNVDDGLPLPLLMHSVMKVVGLPQVCCLNHHDNLVVQVLRAATNYNKFDIWSLIDGKANICITGLLNLLVKVVTITPLPISVATKKGGISLDDCCTKRGLLPLTLADGSVYYQTCYYCKNAVKSIITLQAILAASDVLIWWTQTGHKDGSPGIILFC